jgi:putative PIN family toxin of toxin-antitoxin system
MLRVGIDTNVIVSGVLSRNGAPAEVLDAWRERRFILLISPPVIAEVRAVFEYSRIRNKYPLIDEEIDQTVELLEHDALVVPGESHVAGSVPADSKDEMFLACALDGQADLIVSGDHHLLDLGSYRGIPIISARQFIGKIDKE